MIETLIYLLVVGLILFLVYSVVGMFMGGTPLQIVGLILGLLFLLYALRALKILAVVGLSMWLLGCASVVRQVTDGHPNRDHVPVPVGARAVMMTGTYADADMDGWLYLPCGAGAFRPNNGILQGRDGDVLGYVEASPSGWVFGNLVYGGIPGAIADCIIGGGWDLQPYPKLSIAWKDK